jgi:hypothetical protein
VAARRRAFDKKAQHHVRPLTNTPTSGLAYAPARVCGSLYGLAIAFVVAPPGAAPIRAIVTRTSADDLCTHLATGHNVVGGQVSGVPWG